MENLQEDCLFCQILQGTVQARKVYEDDKCVAVLDINPANPGHILLIPKFHAALLPQLPEEIVEHLAFIAKGLSKALLDTGATGTTVFVANGAAAGQRAPHTMIHIIPRKENDGVGMTLPEQPMPEDMKKQLLDGLRPIMSQVLGGEVVETKEPVPRKEPTKSEESKEPEEKEEAEEEESSEASDISTDLDSIAELFTKNG